MSLLALWKKSHTGKDGSSLSGIGTNDFVDDLNAKAEQLRLMYLTKSQLELENEAFEEIMYQDKIPDRLVGYGLGVKKDDIYTRNIVIDSFKKKSGCSRQKNDKLEKEKEKLKDQVQGNNFLFKTLIGQFSQVVSAVCQEKSSPELLNCTQELLGMAHQQLNTYKGNCKRGKNKPAQPCQTPEPAPANPCPVPAPDSPHPLASPAPATPIPYQPLPCPCHPQPLPRIEEVTFYRVV
ncbi:Isoleucine--tRNA ligase [Bienertia sinuspersici]